MQSALLVRLAEVVRAVADAEISPRWRRLAPADVTSKATESDPDDLVTAADRAAERALTERLPELVPGSVVVGEEAVAADPRVLDLLEGSAPVWLVDPVDGTRNFAAGQGGFGSMIALVDRGTIVAAAIYRIDEPVMYLAERGLGTYRDGKRLVAPERPEGPLAGTIRDRFMPPELRESLARRADAHRRVPSPLCAAVEYPQVLEGEKDYVVYYRVHPWDHAPGALLVREAGGVARRPDGVDYSVSDRLAPVLVASRPDSWERARAELFG